MLDLNGYMKKVGVTKKKYVSDWLAKDLIPGALQDGAAPRVLYSA